MPPTPPRSCKCKNEDPQPEDQKQVLKWVHNSAETKPAMEVKEEKLKVIHNLDLSQQELM